MVSLAEYRKVGEKVRNWGRWGADDQLGTLNFIDNAKLVEAAGTVRKGAVFPLGVDFNADLIWPSDNFRRNPIHVMTVDGGALWSSQLSRPARRRTHTPCATRGTTPIRRGGCPSRRSMQC